MTPSIDSPAGPADVETLRRERDEARAEVERLREALTTIERTGAPGGSIAGPRGDDHRCGWCRGLWTPCPVNAARAALSSAPPAKVVDERCDACRGMLGSEWRAYSTGGRYHDACAAQFIEPPAKPSDAAEQAEAPQPDPDPLTKLYRQEDVDAEVARRVADALMMRDSAAREQGWREGVEAAARAVENHGTRAAGTAAYEAVVQPILDDAAKRVRALAPTKGEP